MNSTSNEDHPQFNATWVLYAPNAHPAWSHYAFLLYDLTTDIPNKPKPIIYAEGATHEFLLFALDPAFDGLYPRGEVSSLEFFDSLPRTPLLSPMNYGYQFYARHDDAAKRRICSLFKRCEIQELSPDTDFRDTWDDEFHDAFPMVNATSSLIHQSLKAKGSGNAH